MYDPVFWKDDARVPQNLFSVTDNGDGTVTAVRAGRVVQQGTNMSAANFGHMDYGIFDAHLATAVYLNLLRQQGWKVDQLAEVVSTLAASGIGTAYYRVEIPVTGWEEDEGGGTYALHLDIPNEEIASTHTPILAIAPEAMSTAIACGLSSTAQTLNGKLRVFAQSVPTARMPCVLTLVGTMPDIEGASRETGASGGVTVSQPAKTTATDSDVDEMLKELGLA